MERDRHDTIGWKQSAEHAESPPVIARVPESLDEELDYDESLDQLLINLDHILNVANSTEAYFDENPDKDAFIVQMTMDGDTKGDQEAAQLTITPDTVRALKYAALSVYEDICEYGEQAKVIAGDVVETWRAPGDVSSIFEPVPPDEIADYQKEVDLSG